MQLVHMDIKPGNIFITQEKRPHTFNCDSSDHYIEEGDPVGTDEKITYKTGKFCMRKVYNNTLSSAHSWRATNSIYCLTSCVFETTMIFCLHYNNYYL
jgi:hypothetical protein